MWDDAKQLTISHGSNIENVETGSGNDTIIGNHLPNTIKSGDGDDTIFAGENADIIYPGAGKNKIDLSEDANAKDLIVLEEINKDDYNIVYGFAQGILGDSFDITYLDLNNLTKLPLVDVVNVPSGKIDNCLIRIFGEGLTNASTVTEFFSINGKFGDLQLTTGNTAILVTANSQHTGEDQNVFSIKQKSTSVDVHHLTQLVGNYLDIDNWSLDNFIV